MKKHLVILAALSLMTANVDAQKLKNLFNSSTTTDVLNAITGGATATTVSLPGTWTYQGSAVDLSGEKALSNVAAAAAESTISSRLDAELAKVGITAGKMKITFKSDSTFICNLGNINVPGTWSQKGTEIRLTCSYAGVIKLLTLDNGQVTGTQNGCQMVFEADNFLAFVKNVLATIDEQGSDATISSIKSLLENYNKLKLGFRLSL